MTKEQVKQELLKYFPNQEEAIKTLTQLGLSESEAKSRVRCSINEIVIYEAAHRIIDRLASYSDDILEKFAKILNVEDSRFSFKTEFLFRAVYFLKKKAYAQYIIEREGALIQEIAQSNIGVKSDVPELTRIMIRDLFKVIMYTNCDQTLINRALTLWESKFRKLIRERSVSICTPCGFNKELKEYKNVNDCIRGMLLYNELIGQEYFKVGMKGFKIYCNGFDYTKLGLDAKQFHEKLMNVAKKLDELSGKQTYTKKPEKLLDRIVIPDDSERIPDWIKLDEKTIMDKVFVSKANEILEPLGIQLDTGTSVALQDLF